MTTLKYFLKIIGLAILGFSTLVGASDFKLNSNSKVTIWPDVLFVQGADLANFNLTIRQTRDQVRKMLWQEFSDTLIPLAMSGADAAALAPILADILLTFDRMHEVHKAEAVKGMNISLESMLRATIDNLYVQYSISDAQRKMSFSRNSEMVSAVKFAQMNQTQLKPGIAEKAFIDVDYFMYGTYTILSGGQIELNLTIENYRSGETRSFLGRGQVQEAIENLSRSVFDFFQGNEYPDWINPQPHLVWVAPAPGAKEMSAQLATKICKSQNARLPFAEELLMAAAASPYQPGGIPEIGEHEVYVVADRTRWNEQEYYFSWRTDEFLGPVKTNAGMGAVLAKYWCVKGDPADSIRYSQNLYRILRISKDSTVKKAIEYLLNQMSDSGANPDFSTAFANVETALMALRKKGFLISNPLN